MRGSENNSTSAFIAASKVGGAGSSILKLSAPKPRRQNLPSSSAIDRYSPLRLRRWLCNKHKISNTGPRRFPYEYLYDTLGLVQLQSLARSLPRAKA
jgi:hypothetical protein